MQRLAIAPSPTPSAGRSGAARPSRPAAGPARHPGHPGSAAEVAAATPASRDRYVDFLRALSIGVVVLGHWTMAVVSLQAGGELVTGNALATAPALRLLTWVLQVMPLFFFVGGFANAVALDSAARRGGTFADFVTSRARRLLRPTAVLVGVWLALGAIPALTGWGAPVLLPTAKALAQPLWFLGIYLIVVALAPVMRRLHRRFGLGVAVTLGVGACLVDALRLPGGSVYGLPVGLGLTGFGPLNFVLVWLFAHQLGFAYADGTLVRARRVSLWALALGGLVGLVVLTGAEAYPASMVGMPGDATSNMSPPSACIVALTCVLVGLAMLARERVNAFLARPLPWTATVAANGMIMTVYLWHLTAMVGVVAVLFPLGFPQTAVPDTGWWLLRPVWLAVCGLALAGMVALLRRFERVPASATPAGARAPVLGRLAGLAAALPARWRGVVAALASACLAVGILGFVASGFVLASTDPVAVVGIPLTPARAVLWCLAGWGLLWLVGQPQRPASASTPRPSSTTPKST